jgi:hypothetical protein
MTYCGSLCEVSDLGATIESMLALQPGSGVVTAAAVAPLDAALASAQNVSTRQSSSLGHGCPCCGGDMYLDEDGSETCIGCGARVVASESYPRH